MKSSYRKSDFLRRGVSGIAAVLVVAGIFIASVGFLSLKFNQGGLFSSPKSFFEKTSALVSKTFGDVFFSGQGRPAAEIDLGERAAGGNGGEIKNSSAATNAPPKIRSSETQSPGEKKSAGKISENKSSDSSAERSNIRSNTNENNFSASSSSGSETSTADNLKISASSPPPLCDFTKAQTPNHKILFSEVAWMGSAKSASDEWLELKNNSGGDVSLAGWQILSGDGNNGSTGSTSSPQTSSPQVKIIFEEKNNVPAGALYLLERSDDNSAPNVPADKIYGGALSNDGARLRIFNANCELADEIDASKGWPAGDNAAKKTMERSSLDLGWHTSANPGGTPKTENSTAFLTGQATGGSVESFQSGSTFPAVDSTPQSGATSNNTASASTSQPSAAAPRILISDIQTTGGSGKSDNDFIKVYNTGDSTADIGGWQLKKRTQSGTESSVKLFPSGASVASRGYFVWANSENGFAVSVGANVSSTAYLSDNYSVALFDSTGKIVDAVAWGSGHANPFVENSPYPTNPAANQILGRKIVNAAMQDTDNNAADFEIR